MGIAFSPQIDQMISIKKTTTTQRLDTESPSSDLKLKLYSGKYNAWLRHLLLLSKIFFHGLFSLKVF